MRLKGIFDRFGCAQINCVQGSFLGIAYLVRSWLPGELRFLTTHQLRLNRQRVKVAACVHNRMHQLVFRFISCPGPIGSIFLICPVQERPKTELVGQFCPQQVHHRAFGRLVTFFGLAKEIFGKIGP